MFKPSITQPPVIPNANQAAYHLLGAQYPRGDARRTMRRGDLWDFMRCPSRWLHGEEQEPTKLMQWGSLIDTTFLTPKDFEKVYVITPEEYETKGMECPSCRSVTDAKKCAKCKCDRIEVTIRKPWDANSNTCKEWIKEQKENGLTALKPDTASEAWKANARLMADDEIAEIRQHCEPQVQINVEWHDKATGLVIPFKCLLDLLPPADSPVGDTIYDLKTTGDADDQPWRRRVYNDGLYFQAGVYIDATNAATQNKYRIFSHIIQESDAPYEPTLRPLDDEFLTIGINSYKAAMAKYCQCLVTQKWPGLSRGPVTREPWMFNSYEDNA